MNVRELKTSNFMKRDDVGDGTIVTISSLERQNVAKEGAPEELKWVMHFDEFDKGLVLNSTNGQLIAHALKSEESDDWIGKQIILFDDPSVSFGGKLTGGIRVRPVAKAAAAPPPRQTATALAPATGAAKNELKAKFKSHPEFGKGFSVTDVNTYLEANYGAKLDNMNEVQCKDALGQFDSIVQSCMDSIPF